MSLKKILSFATALVVIKIVDDRLNAPSVDKKANETKEGQVKITDSSTTKEAEEKKEPLTTKPAIMKVPDKVVEKKEENKTPKIPQKEPLNVSIETSYMPEVDELELFEGKYDLFVAVKETGEEIIYADFSTKYLGGEGGEKYFFNFSFAPDVPQRGIDFVKRHMEDIKGWIDFKFS